MRRVLGTLLLVTLLLAGCGDDGSGDEAEEPAPASPSATEEPTFPNGQSGDGWQLVEIVHATAVDGQVSTTPTPVGDAAAVADFSAQFTRPDLHDEILRVVQTAQVPAGSELVAAVISIGCDVPPGVIYLDGEVRPQKVISPHKECFAAMTSVAILAVGA